MTFSERMIQIFSSNAQTNDNHTNEQLQTHYYKTTSAQAIRVVEEVLNTISNYEIKSIQEERGEIGVALKNTKRGLMIITITMVRPFHTAIDISVSTESKLSLGFGKKTIINFYQKLDSKLTLNGKGNN